MPVATACLSPRLPPPGRFAISLTIVVVNKVLGAATTQLVEMEKHWSKSGQVG